MTSIKYYLIGAVAIFYLSAQAQDKKSAGAIYYTQTTSMKGATVTLSGGGGAAPAGLPDKITSEGELIFNTNGAKYQKSVNDAAGGGINLGGVIISRGADRKVFINYADNKVSELTPLAGEEFMVENKLGYLSDTVTKTEETKTIIGFNCKKAVVKNKGVETTIWYTTDIKAKASPQPGFWVDGVVLAIQNERVSYLATSIEYDKVKDSEITPPKDVKVITAEELKGKQQEIMKRIQSGGGGNVVRFGN